MQLENLQNKYYQKTDFFVISLEEKLIEKYLKRNMLKH
jgi:hypothetical protein